MRKYCNGDKYINKRSDTEGSNAKSALLEKEKEKKKKKEKTLGIGSISVRAFILYLFIFIILFGAQHLPNLS